MTENPPISTFTARYEEIVRLCADKVALRAKTAQGYRQVTYREFDRQARGIALGLRALGLQRGMRAAVLSENRPEWVAAYFGIFLAGGTVVPLDALISPAEWRNLLEDSESQYVFVSGALLEKLLPVVFGTPAAGNLICLDPVPGETGAARAVTDLIEWGYSQSPPADLPEPSMDDVLTLIYTSGTTGKPKGVMLTQSNIMHEIVGGLAVIHVNERDSLLCLLPLQHVLGAVINVLIPVYLGARVDFADTLKRTEILAALEEGKITVLATVPQFFYLLHKRIEEELARKPALVRRMFFLLCRLTRFCRSVLRFNPGRFLFGRIHRVFGRSMRLFVSGGSAFDPRVAQVFYDLGFRILQGYGLTETSGACNATPENNSLMGSVGRPLPGCEIRIVDPDESGVGEVAVRGPVVMRGYYKNPEGTEATMQDGWFLTGDLGRTDERGNLFVTGRKKEVIVLPSGKNIYPDELEAHYGQCPYIREIAVIGIADRAHGERSEKVHAVIVPDFDYLKEKRIANVREVLRDEVARWSNRLPPYKRLLSYQIQADPLPRTTTRKIKRLELKSLIEHGALAGMESAGAGEETTAEDQELLQTMAGQEVFTCLREAYHRDQKIELGMNLELDLGFDSMERVELLSSLEQALGLKLPNDFGVEIFTVRDLITRLDAQVASSPESSAAARQSWRRILAPETLARDSEAEIRFSGRVLSAFKFCVVRSLYLLFRILLRLEVSGLQNLPARGPYMICPNHLSYIDAFVVVSVLPFHAFERLFFVGWSAIFQGGLMKLFARLANVVPVDPDANLLRAMKVGARGLQQGRILCIFPEGGRSFDGRLQEFRKGAAILAKEVAVPVVPVGLQGPYEVWARGSRRVRLHKVFVCFGPPMYAEAATYEKETERLRDAVAALIRA